MLEGDMHLKLGRFSLQTGGFAWPNTGVTAVFGPSGCGKSTLLRCLAGLEPQVRGRLSCCGTPWLDGRQQAPAYSRDIGFVFQDAALFPHLSVRQNLQFAAHRAGADDIEVELDARPSGLTRSSRHRNLGFVFQEPSLVLHLNARGNLQFTTKRARVGGSDIERVASEVGLEGKLDRGVNLLSGGERQRVAIARALLSSPRLLLMDEPLAALDWRSKADILGLLQDVIARTGLPVVFITHAPAEVLRLADRVVFMQDGRITGIESLVDAAARADSPLFEEEGDCSAVLQAAPAGQEHGLHGYALGATDVFWLAPEAPAKQRRGATTRLLVRARDVGIALSKPLDASIVNQFQAHIVDIQPATRPEHVLLQLELGCGQRLFAEVTRAALLRLQLRTGMQVWALIKAVALVV
ncbi:MAG: ATP-binding cassette domain-containing protein [Thiomonas sp.]|nr:ATP-binding cassette domain-containing protein [Thiomonas sp.]